MTAFATALGTLFINPDLSIAAWWLAKDNSKAEIRVIVTVPEADELLGRAPMSLRQRFIDLQSDVPVEDGDLLAFDGTTWLFAGYPNPDKLRLSHRWITTLQEGDFTYHPDGYPLLTWNGAAWV
jgi:hypothetical protein